MPRIAPQEFLAQPFRVHTFLSGVVLHDVWVVDLLAVSGRATLEGFHRRTKSRNLAAKMSWPARALFGLRFFLGRIFGWDQEPEEGKPAYFAERLTAEDRERSKVPSGTLESFFRVVYSFENETLLEVINGTAHAALVSALAETPQVARLSGYPEAGAAELGESISPRCGARHRNHGTMMRDSSRLSSGA